MVTGKRILYIKATTTSIFTAGTMALVRDAEEASDSEELQKSEAADTAGGNVAGVAAVGTGWPYLTGTRRAPTSLGFRCWTCTPKT